MSATLGSTSQGSMLQIAKSVKAIVDAIPMCAIMTDPSLIITYANKHAASLFDEPSQEIAGNELTELLQRCGFKGDFSQFTKQAEALDQSESIVTAQIQDALARTVTITGSRVASESKDGDSSYVFFMRQQDSGAAYDARIIEMDRMLTRGEMAAEIAHEMNNFLTILIGNTELIPMFINNGDYHKAIDKLAVMKGTLGRIAILTESLVEYGKHHNTRIISNLNEMIESTLEFFSPQNRFDRIDIKTALAEDIPPVRGDIGKLQQLIGNLIHNAADELNVAPADHKTISITTEVAEDGKFVVITIADTGRGVDESVKSRIFRERCSTKPGGEGFGLLACKQIVDNHGGTITFDTVLGAGACFTVRIPAAASIDSDAPPAAADTTGSNADQ